MGRELLLPEEELLNVLILQQVIDNEAYLKLDFFALDVVEAETQVHQF